MQNTTLFTNLVELFKIALEQRLKTLKSDLETGYIRGQVSPLTNW
jgi:hypothetical protein